MNSSDQRAEEGFLVFLRLGPRRTYQAVADQLALNESTVRRWAKKNGWKEQIQAVHDEVRRKVTHAETELALVKYNQAAEWENRNAEMRELQWAHSKEAFEAGHEILKKFTSGEIEKCSLGEAARLIQLGSTLGISAINQAQKSQPTPQTPQRSPMDDLREAWEKIAASRVVPIPPSDPDPSQQN